MKFLINQTSLKECISTIYRAPFFVLLVFFMSTNFSIANAGMDVTFSWQANPVDDNVIGYRRYYGTKSRFNTNGSLKSNFSYDYFIDFSELERCDAANSDALCETLSSDELQCESLYQSNPKCTVSNLNGYLYFTLVAYNAQDESDYTHELEKNLEVTTEVPEVPGGQRYSGSITAINLLLL